MSCSLTLPPMLTKQFLKALWNQDSVKIDPTDPFFEMLFSLRAAPLCLPFALTLPHLVTKMSRSADQAFFAILVAMCLSSIIILLFGARLYLISTQVLRRNP